MDSQTAAELLGEMTADDRRDMGRLDPVEQLNGALNLQVDDEILDIVCLRDVSPFGLGLEASHAVAPGVYASLMYEVDDERLQVEGIILWAKTLPREAGDDRNMGRYQLGLKLDPGNVADNLRFYRRVTNQ
jgi:hypothetical protein